jgi:glycolate oxidase iron-sulfur subunit
MQTRFTDAQRADPAIAESESILRTCVHCGFCTATCPTYVLLGDELDGPRGRIYLIKDMLESGGPATATVVTHVDRCLSCLGCMTTCPSGVDYMHLVDHARAHIEQTYQRPLADRLVRALLARVLPHPGRFRLAVRAAALGRALAVAVPARLKPLLALAPKSLPPSGLTATAQLFPAEGERRYRIALLAGCVQDVLDPTINDATIRLLTRHGCEVVVAPGSGCCGALAHHLGRTDESRAAAAANIAAWTAEVEGQGLDAIVVNASGCGTMVKDYGHLLRNDATLAGPAARVAGLARDVSEFVAMLPLAPAGDAPAVTVAYHSACSLRNGQRITDLPKRLLAQAGFRVLTPAEDHLCCGSAGTYNLLQPAIAGRLRARKAANLERTGAAAIAAGNIGCMVQIAGATKMPVVHTAALLDWATGGPVPPALAAEEASR